MTHVTLKHGDPCPEPGCGGRLYVQRRGPAVLVRVTGGRPLAAQVYELERLRCGLCGAVFTAEPPAGVGDLFMSLIHTAELHQIGPFRYLVALQRHAAAVVLDPSAWMPWTYTQALAVAESGLAAT